MNPACPSCESEVVTPRRVYRHGSVVVFLGHFLLVPSILVVLFASMGVVGVRSQENPSAMVNDALSAAAALETTGVPERIAAGVVALRPISESQLASLTTEQREAVRRMQMASADHSTRSSMSRFTSGSTFQLVVGAALASGVLGLCFVRKKSVLHCPSCGTRS